MPHFAALRRVNQIVQSLPKNQVNMNLIFDDDANVNFAKVKTGEYKECGAVCCAIGWAALDPYFRKRGLKIKKNGDLYFGGDEMDYDFAAAQLFDITPFTARDLFGPWVGGSRDHRKVFESRLKQFFADHGETL